jgi:uncharacterized protein YecA (UPF0149 family)
MEKTGRNDPCPCGSGKKYKQCCLSKKGGSGVKRKITAKWLNPKQQHEEGQAGEMVSLMDRAFGFAAENKEDVFQSVVPTDHSEGDESKKEQKIEEKE